MTLWLDVEDLFQYGVINRRPSGIQRLSFELYSQLNLILGSGVKFCRHDPVAGTLRTVPWNMVQEAFMRLLAPLPPDDAPQKPYSLARFSRIAGLRALAERLPPELRVQLSQAYRAQRHALAAQGAALKSGVRAIAAVPAALRAVQDAKRRAGVPAASGVPFRSEDARNAMRPGDTLGVLGSPWFHPDYAGFVNRIAKARGVGIAVLIYDLIPLVHPEWCDRELVRVFGGWFSSFIPHADTILTISNASAREIERWAARTGTPIALPITTLPIGSGFSTGPAGADAALPRGLGTDPFVLLVSTIEARKNHQLAFRVWRRMLDQVPRRQVPRLVFAGRVGWLVGDLMQQLENCNHLDGMISVITNPSDAELAALYRGCRLTLYPSLYEGWGLPVSESLHFGKVCVASNRTSVPEAGGSFCIYFDPENTDEATQVILRACTDDRLIASIEERIRAEFRPTSWRTSAETLLGCINGGRAGLQPPPIGDSGMVTAGLGASGSHL